MSYLLSTAEAVLRLEWNNDQIISKFLLSTAEAVLRRCQFCI